MEKFFNQDAAYEKWDRKNKNRGRDNYFEEDGQIIARETIEKSIDSGETYRIVIDGETAGGVVINVNGDKGDLNLLFVSPYVHSKGIGYAA